MSIQHILMYRFKDEVPESRIDEHLAFIESARGQHTGLLDLKCGREVGKKARQYSHGFVMVFESQQALDDYNASPWHDELVSTFKGYVDDKLVFDFSTDS